jgi:ribose 5-phosphate isomerase B
MRIALGSDHASYALKSQVVEYLRSLGHEVADMGTHSTESCDYPDFGLAVARSVASGESDVGILGCWTGNGMVITANKVKGVRAALAVTPRHAALAKQHNNANVLCLSAYLTSFDHARDILDAFFSAEFEGGRHERRVGKIEAAEAG